MRWIAGVALLAVSATACSLLSAGLPTTTTIVADPSATDSSPPAADAITARDCRTVPDTGEIEVARIDAGDLVTASIAVSQAGFACAEEVVISAADDLRWLALAAQLAAALDGPLLLAAPAAEERIAAELARLSPQRVTLLGSGLSVSAPPGATVTVFEGSQDQLADLVLDHLGGMARVELGVGGLEAVAGVLASIAAGRRVSLPQAGVVAGCPQDARALVALEGLAPGGPVGEDVWLVDRCSPLLALAVASAAGTDDRGTVLLVDGADLRSVDSVVASLRAGSSRIRRVHLVGVITSDAEWQLDGVLGGLELPGGGLTLFPGNRLVALYGNPTTPALGVLGEQGPEAAVERAVRIAAQYGADGLRALPAFEIIATVASSRAGVDGDYSYEMPLEDLRPWIDVARREGVYVILDLQPGRTDFLTQAKLYAELLLEPHVGLALDPEWRLEPDQRHLRQIGSVDAAEVNEVVEYLAGLVRDHRLPQKLLVLHQFNLQMITNRARINTPAELAVLIQMDGQGPIQGKYETYGALTSLPDADRWWWGWKNFYDEDSPTPTPSQVLDLAPVPVYVSYQ